MDIAETLKSTGSKRTASAKSVGKSKHISRAAKVKYPFFVICINNSGYEPFLWLGKIYQVITPEPFDGRRHLRVIDEEGEDYLFGADRFVRVAINSAAARKVIGQRSSRFE